MREPSDRLSVNQIKFIMQNKNELYPYELAEKIGASSYTVYKFLRDNKIEHKYGKIRSVNELTATEKQIMSMIAQGLDDQEIAEELVVALATVRTHKNRIYKKYGVSGRTARVKAVLKYLKMRGASNEINTNHTL